jgi:membrane protease YdiL (CAAX protease family)
MILTGGGSSLPSGTPRPRPGVTGIRCGAPSGAARESSQVHDHEDQLPRSDSSQPADAASLETRDDASEPLFAPAPYSPPPPPEPYANYPQDLRVPWTWMDLLIIFLLWLGLQVTLDFALMSLAVAFKLVPMDPHAMEQFARMRPGYITIRQILFWGLLLGFLYFILGSRSRRSFWQLMGFVPYRVQGIPAAGVYGLFLLAGVPLAILVQLVSARFKPPDTLPVEIFFRDAVSVLMFTALGILVAPVMEELLFRGVFYPVVARTLGVRGAVIFVGLLFGAVHAAQLWGGWMQIVLLCVVGITLTYARARTGSVIPPFLLHLGYNSFLFLGYIVSTGFLKNLPAR